MKKIIIAAAIGALASAVGVVVLTIQYVKELEEADGAGR